MDFETIPYELLEEIFSYLKDVDLWECLGVSRRWRDAANINKLWAKHCSKLGINDPSLTTVPVNEELCEWAAAYHSQYLMPKRNWRRKQFTTFQVPIEDGQFIEVWKGSRGAVYYYHIDKLMIHEVHSQGVRSSQLSGYFKGLSQDVYSVSIGLNKDYVAISNCNIVIVYRKTEAHTFEAYKIIHVSDGTSKIAEYNETLLKRVYSEDTSLQVKSIIGDVVWIIDIYIDNYLIVDLLSDNIVVKESRPYCSFSLFTPYVASWDDSKGLVFYTKDGSNIIELSIPCWDVCFNSQILVLGNKTTQSIETWDIESRKQYISKRVLYHTDIVIPPTKNVVVLTEKTKALYRITCIDAVNGDIIWRISPPSQHDRCHVMKVVSEYLFIWYSSFMRPKFVLLDLANGKELHSGLLPQNKTHVSNTVWVFLENDHFKLMSFLG